MLLMLDGMSRLSLGNRRVAGGEGGRKGKKPDDHAK